MKKIMILGLGGTISSNFQGNPTEFYNHPSIDISEYLSDPIFHDNSDELCVEQYSQQISQDMTDIDLVKVAKKINNIISSNKFEGLIVTQGTNCIEEVSFFINLVIKTEIPIVFTGALRPYGSLGFDGIRNLHNAITIIKSTESIKSGVLLTFNDYIYSARDIQKINPSIINAFSDKNLGLLSNNKCFFNHSVHYKHTYKSDFDISHINELPEVCVLYGHIGLNSFFIEAAINQMVKGIISAGVGKGYQSSAINQCLKKATDHGIIVVRASRTGQGMINRDPSTDEKYGFVAGGGLSPQKARLLLSTILTKTNEIERIQSYFFEY